MGGEGDIKKTFDLPAILPDEVPPTLAESAPSNLRTTAAGCLVAVATLAVMILTEPRLAIVWDEGYTLGREVRIRTWLRALRDPAGFSASWHTPRTELVQVA